MQGNIKVLIAFFLIALVGRLAAQNPLRVSKFKDSITLLLPPTNYNNVLPLGKSYAPVTPRFQLARDQVVRSFAFFCKTEWQLEKKTTIPFKFRLGSVEQTDYWEGKPNTKRY